MARITIPCLVGKTNQAGITSWYWQPSATLARAGWKSLTLGKDEGTALAAARARNAEVAAWKDGGQRPVEIARRVNTGTVGALVARYRRDVIEHGIRPDGRKRIAARTAESYGTALKRIEMWAGDKPLAYVTPARIGALRDAMLAPEASGGIGHAAAHSTLKMARQLFAFAESIDLIARGSNPATSFGLGAPRPRAAVWEADDEGAFVAAAYALGYPGLALACELAIYTAQRETDLIGFTENQFAEIGLYDAQLIAQLAGKDGQVKGWIITQHKTGAALEIPFDPIMRAKVERALAANRAKDRAADPARLITYVLVNDRTGLPWTKRNFIRAWTRVLAHAAKATGRTHMTDLVWHDLRRTRVVRLRRRNTPREAIAALTGTSPRSIEAMLKVYGPIDPTMTAAVIGASLTSDAAAAKATAAATRRKKPSNKSR